MQITYSGSASGFLQAGMSHEVTLNISYNEPDPDPDPDPGPGTDPDPEPEKTPLTITVAVGEWKVVDAGDLGIEQKNVENEK